MEAVAVHDSPLSRNPEMLDTRSMLSQFDVGLGKAAGAGSTYVDQNSQSSIRRQPLVDGSEREPSTNVRRKTMPVPGVFGEVSVQGTASSPAHFVTQSETAIALSGNVRDAPGLGQAAQGRHIAETDEPPESHPSAVVIGSRTDKKGIKKSVISSLMTSDMEALTFTGLPRNVNVVSSREAAHAPAGTSTNKRSERHPSVVFGNGTDQDDYVRSVISSLSTLLVQSATVTALSKSRRLVPADSVQLSHSPAITDKEEKIEVYPAAFVPDTGLRRGAPVDACDRSPDENGVNSQRLAATTLQSPLTENGAAEARLRKSELHDKPNARKPVKQNRRHSSAQSEADTGNATGSVGLDTSATHPSTSPLEAAPPSGASGESGHEPAGDVGTSMTVPKHLFRREIIEGTCSSGSHSLEYVAPSMRVMHGASGEAAKLSSSGENIPLECDPGTKGMPSSVLAVVGLETTTGLVPTNVSAVNPDSLEKIYNDGRSGVQRVGASGTRRKCEAKLTASGGPQDQTDARAGGTRLNQVEGGINDDQRNQAASDNSASGVHQLKAGQAIDFGIHSVSSVLPFPLQTANKPGVSEIASVVVDGTGSDLSVGTDIPSPGVIGLKGVYQAVLSWVQHDVVGPAVATVASGGAAPNLNPHVHTSDSRSATGAFMPSVLDETLCSNRSETAAVPFVSMMPITGSSALDTVAGAEIKREGRGSLESEYDNSICGDEHTTESGPGRRGRRVPRDGDRVWTRTEALSMGGERGGEIPCGAQMLPHQEKSLDDCARFDATHGSPACGGGQDFHPARLFHLLWQRDRYGKPS